jgi:hypothetical protein
MVVCSLLAWASMTRLAAQHRGHGGVEDLLLHGGMDLEQVADAQRALALGDPGRRLSAALIVAEQGGDHRMVGRQQGQRVVRFHLALLHFRHGHRFHRCASLRAAIPP